MASRRDWLLQQIGITQYRLRRPRVLHGEIAISLSPETRLLIVAEAPPTLNDMFIHDVLSALNIADHQTMILTPEQLQMLPEEVNCAGWLLGVDCAHTFNGVRLRSPLLNELTGSADAGGAPSGDKFVNMTAISLLTTADLDAAYAIERRCQAFPWAEQTFAASQGERYINLRLTVEDRLAAFAITQVVLDEATLFNLAVDPPFQRRGYARQLLQYLIAQLSERDVMTLWLEVRASNQSAISLYQQMDFHLVTRRANYYPAPVDVKMLLLWR